MWIGPGAGGVGSGVVLVLMVVGVVSVLEEVRPPVASSRGCSRRRRTTPEKSASRLTRRTSSLRIPQPRAASRRASSSRRSLPPLDVDLEARQVALGRLCFHPRQFRLVLEELQHRIGRAANLHHVGRFPCLDGLHRLVEFDPPLVDDDDPLAHLLDLGQDVRREQHRVLAAEFPDGVERLADLHRVEARGRLVEDQDGRIGEHARRPGRRAGGNPSKASRAAGSGLP